MIAVTLETLNDDVVEGRPAVGIGPLRRHAAEHKLANRQRVGRRQTAFILKPAQPLD